MPLASRAPNSWSSRTGASTWRSKCVDQPRQHAQVLVGLQDLGHAVAVGDAEVPGRRAASPPACTSSARCSRAGRRRSAASRRSPKPCTCSSGRPTCVTTVRSSRSCVEQHRIVRGHEPPSLVLTIVAHGFSSISGARPADRSPRARGCGASAHRASRQARARAAPTGRSPSPSPPTPTIRCWTPASTSASACLEVVGVDAPGALDLGRVAADVLRSARSRISFLRLVGLGVAEAVPHVAVLRRRA